MANDSGNMPATVAGLSLRSDVSASGWLAAWILRGEAGAAKFLVCINQQDFRLRHDPITMIMPMKDES